MKIQKLMVCILVFVLFLPLVAAYNVNLICPSSVVVGNTLTCSINLDTTVTGGNVFGAQFVIVAPDYRAGVPLIAGVNGVDASTAGLSSGILSCSNNNQTILLESDFLSTPGQAAGLVANINLNTAGMTAGNHNVGLNCLTNVDNAANQVVTVNIVASGNCGNGVVEGAEECDLGNNNGIIGQTCSNSCLTWLSCTINPSNGNSVIMQTSAGPINFNSHCNPVDNSLLTTFSCVQPAANAVSYTNQDLPCLSGLCDPLTLCAVTTPEICNNNLDDDGNGATDCADQSCLNNPLCPGANVVCVDNQNMVTAPCNCQQPLEQIGNVCTGLLGRIRNILNDDRNGDGLPDGLTRLQKITAIAQELRNYLL